MKAKPVIATILILLALGAAPFGVRLVKARLAAGGAPQMGEPAFAVETTAARSVQWQPRADLVGTVIALRSIVLSNEVEGVVTQVGFETGSIVEEGQVVIVLDSSIEQADLEAARANVRVSETEAAVIQADIGLWESNLRRLEPAVASKAAPATDLDNARAQLAGARARLQRSEAEVAKARASVAQVEVKLAKKNIKAPFRARAGVRSIHPGQFVALGTQIVGLQGITDRIYLDFAIPQEYAQRVKAGDFVTANSSVLGDEPVRIEVAGVDAVVNPDTRNVRVRAIVPNLGDTLRPGMFVDISVPVESPIDRVVVPATAVRRAPYGDHVFLVVADPAGGERVKQSFVKLGPALGADVIVTEGLKVGERIAAAGSFKLRDGAKIMPPPAAQPDGAQPSKSPGH
ncbi:MAG: efflux RND transporter periplasmic adaptor subunit [Phycisphaerales bacterium]